MATFLYGAKVRQQQNYIRTTFIFVKMVRKSSHSFSSQIKSFKVTYVYSDLFKYFRTGMFGLEIEFIKFSQENIIKVLSMLINHIYILLSRIKSNQSVYAGGAWRRGFLSVRHQRWNSPVRWWQRSKNHPVGQFFQENWSRNRGIYNDEKQRYFMSINQSST